jgi:hypothetical protein
VAQLKINAGFDRMVARQRADAERRVDWQFSHVGVCLRKLEQEGEIEFDDPSDQWDMEKKEVAVSCRNAGPVERVES